MWRNASADTAASKEGRRYTPFPNRHQPAPKPPNIRVIAVGSTHPGMVIDTLRFSMLQFLSYLFFTDVHSGHHDYSKLPLLFAFRTDLGFFNLGFVLSYLGVP